MTDAPPTDSPAPATVQPRQRGVARLVTDMATDAAALARKELDLAKAEMAQKGKSLGGGVAVLGAAAVFAYAAICVLVAAAVLGLAVWVAAWLAALIVFGVFALVAVILVFVGINLTRRSAPLAPTAAIEQAKQDVAWAKRQLK